jgi:hypothetical protein
MLPALVVLLALMGHAAAQTPQTVTPEDIVKQQCGVSTVPAVSQALLKAVLDKCGPSQNVAKAGVCDACGCAAERVLAVLSASIIKQKKVADWRKLSEACRLTLSLYTFVKANLTFERANAVADKCSTVSNKGLWNVATLQIC